MPLSHFTFYTIAFHVLYDIYASLLRKYWRDITLMTALVSQPGFSIPTTKISFSCALYIIIYNVITPGLVSKIIQLRIDIA